LVSQSRDGWTSVALRPSDRWHLDEMVVPIACPPGLRIGWAITRDAELRRQLVVGKFNTIVSCPRVDEVLALKLFERRAPILAERRVLLDAGWQRTAA
jgi:hypothetical protein